MRDNHLFEDIEMIGLMNLNNLVFEIELKLIDFNYPLNMREFFQRTLNKDKLKN